MIYATVGTDTHDFSRLVKEMDAVARTMRVVIQTGNSSYRPRHAEWFRFEREEVIADFFRKADVIVTHGGAGSIIRSLSNGKVPIVVPRLKKFGEHVNDHQEDLARSLGKQGKIILVTDVSDLKKQLRKRTVRLKRRGNLTKRLNAYLEGLT